MREGKQFVAKCYEQNKLSSSKIDVQNGKTKP